MVAVMLSSLVILSPTTPRRGTLALVGPNAAKSAVILLNWSAPNVNSAFLLPESRKNLERSKRMV